MAANPERGELDLVVNGQTYTLRATMNGLCTLEQRAGRTYGVLVSAMADTDVSAMRQLLFTFLQPYHAAAFRDLDAVGRLMDDLGDPMHVREALTRFVLLNRSRKPADPLAAQASTGDSSGSTPGASA